MGQRTEFTFEVEETVVLRQGGKIARDSCPRCQLEVDLVSPDVLSLITCASEREIFRLVEAGKVYFVETDRLVVCVRCFSGSVFKQPISETKRRLKTNHRY
jgi:hypothetical protein